MEIINLTNDKDLIIEYIRYNTKFGKDIDNYDISKIEVSLNFEPNLIIFNKGIGDGFMLRFDYGDYKNWLRYKKLKKLTK